MRHFALPFALDFELGTILLMLVCVLLSLVVARIAFCKSMIETIILMSVFSLLISLSYLLMDAPDVAMTEVALGACLSTCVLLNFIRSLQGNFANRQIVSSLALCIGFAATLFWVVLDLPIYGDASSPLQSHVSKYYVENTSGEIGIPSIVAAVLASYRGYDTLGETSVILIAGLGALLIMSFKKGKIDV